jgi:hypothetical protein
MIAVVARALGPDLLQQVAFVGGCKNWGQIPIVWVRSQLFCHPGPDPGSMVCGWMQVIIASENSKLVIRSKGVTPSLHWYLRSILLT